MAGRAVFCTSDTSSGPVDACTDILPSDNTARSIATSHGLNVRERFFDCLVTAQMQIPVSNLLADRFPGFVGNGRAEVAVRGGSMRGSSTVSERTSRREAEDPLGRSAARRCRRCRSIIPIRREELGSSGELQSVQPTIRAQNIRQIFRYSATASLTSSCSGFGTQIWTFPKWLVPDTATCVLHP
jgi:hypothetical protein